MSPQLLQIELAYFDKHRSNFLKKAEGKFVLIKGKKDHGFYDSAESAYKAGVELFDLKPFLIKEVLPEDEIHEIPAHYLGLINASI